MNNPRFELLRTNTPDVLASEYLKLDATCDVFKRKLQETQGQVEVLEHNMKMAVGKLEVYDELTLRIALAESSDCVPYTDEEIEVEKKEIAMRWSKSHYTQQQKERPYYTAKGQIEANNRLINDTKQKLKENTIKMVINSIHLSFFLIFSLDCLQGDVGNK